MSLYFVLDVGKGKVGMMGSAIAFRTGSRIRADRAKRPTVSRMVETLITPVEDTADREGRRP